MRLTPRQFGELQDGWNWRREHEHQNRAWLATHIYKAAGAKGTPKMIFKKLCGDDRRIRDIEQADRLKDIKRRASEMFRNRKKDSA